MNADLVLDRWADRITAALQRTVEGIFETGRALAEAKAALAHGEWLRLFTEGRVPLGPRAAQVYMTIWSSQARLLGANAKCVSSLPPSVGTLYELAALPPAVLEEHRGEITPDLERQDVIGWRREESYAERFAARDKTPDTELLEGGAWRVVHGDAWQLARAPSTPVQAIVTSPPYWRQRVYQHGAEFGQEGVTDYIRKLVALFTHLQGWLRTDGALWVNLGDSYADDNLQAIPHRFVIAMIDAGWQLKSEVIFERENLTPRPARKRPTRAHEHVLLFTLSANYYYDERFMREPAKYAGYKFRRTGPRVDDTRLRMDGTITVATTRNVRSVWRGATGWNGTIHHPALMPKLMAERCVQSVTRPGDTVLDPFCGGGTTGLVALQAGRSFLGWDIDARYVARSRSRLANAVALLGQEVTA